ncbi:MAG TPA: AMP-binding protein, partial [Mycobacteriales bacterium]|nr:AMP-binding protein [Mycobacteriales bacterium]
MTDSPLVARARQHALGDLPRRTALRVPGKTAVVDGDVRLTFAEFDAAVGRLAAALAARGVGKGDRLAVLSHNCWQYGALAFATARLGVVLVPINFMLGPDEIGFILDHSGTTAIVAEDALAEVADKAIAQSGVTPGVRATIMLGTPPGPQLGWEDVDAWLA